MQRKTQDLFSIPHLQNILRIVVKHKNNIHNKQTKVAPKQNKRASLDFPLLCADIQNCGNMKHILLSLWV